MANTFIEYTGNGSTTNYSFTFEYIKEAEVKVTIDGTATTAFTFANATTLSFTTAPANNAKIRIYRETDVSNLKATFFAGSAIKAEDLNDNFTQNNFAVEELRESTWDFDTETIKSGETWSSVDTQIATTEAIDNRVSATIDTAITNDIGTDGTGVTVTDDGDGTITLGLAQNTIDLDRLKNSDIINNAEQDAQSPAPADTNIFTALAAKTRHDTLIQTGTPAGSTYQTGKFWYQNDSDKTFHVWNGSSWEGITSGGTFTKLEKVIYVDSINGDDTNDGHRISTPKASIKGAVEAINDDSTYGDGSVVLVAPGIYQEAAPIDIEKRDVAIIGASIRNVIVHPTAATETNSLFRVNSGTYLHNMTFTGMKASGTRGDTGSLWEDSTYGLPPTQGWNVSFYPDAMIYKSPYIQNCTNFSDSEIDNSNLAFYAGTEDKGRAGDLDSAPTGGGLLVDGSTPHDDSPLRSIVADSYTHTGLDAPGIFVTNNGYAQCTSSYAFFNHFHIACLNGGQANLAASTSDFGEFSLIADGRSTSAIFTASTTASAADGSTTFTIDAPTAASGWHGSATRPQDNMLVDIGGNTYPVLSAVAAGSGWTVTISRPDTSDRTQNLGLNGAVSSGASVSFFLRSMIASSGHTMEYVGSGTDYSALPENGGVPDDTKQIKELNNGKVWAAITDHQGTFKVGETFTVDQQTGFVNIPAGALSVQTLLENLDVNGKKIVSDSNNENVVISPHGTGTVDVESSRITSVSDPTGAQDAATKNYVDNFTGGTSNIGDSSVTNAKLASGAVDTTKMSGATVVTNSEHSAATTNDTSFFTTSASDARYFRQDSSETIESGDTWSSNDARIATTAAIDARVIDLVDDVGGFVPIASETSFPTSNPDVNDGAGTLISIKEIGTSRTPSSGTVTIANGSGSNTVTITGCGTTVLSAGFGAIVETTSTLHTYTFHRLTPKATEVTTVAGISSNVTTVAGVSSNVTTVAGISSDVTTVAGISSDVTAVAGRATEIGRLGTADAVADMNTLGTADVVADLNTLGTADVVSDMNTLATSSNVTAMSNCSDDISNINTVSGSISNVNTVAGSISNVNTVATNMSSVNSFAARYRVSATAPTTSLDDGDLWFDTTADTLKIYDASSSAWVTGVTDTTGFVTTSGATMTGQLNTITPTSGDNATNKTYVDGTIDSKIDTALTSDVVGGTGITVSDNTPGNGQITVAVTAGSIGATQLASTSVSAGTYGASQSGVPSFTVDADGRLTAASTDTSPSFSGNVTIASGATILYSDGDVLFTGDVGNFKWDKSDSSLIIQDDARAKFGTDGNLQIYHDGNLSFISQDSANRLIIRNTSNDQDIDLESDNGSGGLTTYVKCDGSTGEVDLYYYGSRKLNTKSDGIDVTGAGTFSGDVQTGTARGVDGTGASLESFGGVRAARPSSTADPSNSNVWEGWYGTTVTSAIRADGSAIFNGNVDLHDNDRLRLGNGDDLQIWHDGTNSNIHNNTNNLIIRNNADNSDIYLQTDNGSGTVTTYILCDGSDGKVRLYNYGSEKLNTKSDGIDVTGEVQCDSLDVDGVANIQGVITAQGGAVAEIDTLSSASTITPNFANSCNFTVTLGTNTTIANPSNLTAGQSGSIFIVQDGTGSRTAAFGSYWDFAGGAAPTLTTTANGVDRIDYIVRSSTSIHAVATLAYS